MNDRFDFEENLMKCWHVTDDIDVVLNMVADTNMDAKDHDKLMNVLLGMKEMYNFRFSTTFEMFEELVRDKHFTEKH